METLYQYRSSEERHFRRRSYNRTPALLSGHHSPDVAMKLSTRTWQNQPGKKTWQLNPCPLKLPVGAGGGGVLGGGQVPKAQGLKRRDCGVRHRAIGKMLEWADRQTSVCRINRLYMHYSKICRCDGIIWLRVGLLMNCWVRDIVGHCMLWILTLCGIYCATYRCPDGFSGYRCFRHNSTNSHVSVQCLYFCLYAWPYARMHGYCHIHSVVWF